MVFDPDYPQFENLETGELLTWYEVYDGPVCAGKSCADCDFDLAVKKD